MISLMDYLTTQEAAEKLGVSRQRVVVLIQADRLPATKAGRDWLILPADLESFERRPQGNHKLTEDQSRLIRRLAGEGQPPEALAKRFKVSVRTIYRHLNK
jgi:excisionase family DNA binding protein